MQYTYSNATFYCHNKRRTCSFTEAQTADFAHDLLSLAIPDHLRVILVKFFSLFVVCCLVNVNSSVRMTHFFTPASGSS